MPLYDKEGNKDTNTDTGITYSANLLSTDPSNLKIIGAIFNVSCMESLYPCIKIIRGVSM